MVRFRTHTVMRFSLCLNENTTHFRWCGSVIFMRQAYTRIFTSQCPEAYVCIQLLDYANANMYLNLWMNEWDGKFEFFSHFILCVCAWIWFENILWWFLAYLRPNHYTFCPKNDDYPGLCAIRAAVVSLLFFCQCSTKRPKQTKRNPSFWKFNSCSHTHTQNPATCHENHFIQI